MGVMMRAVGCQTGKQADNASFPAMLTAISVSHTIFRDNDNTIELIFERVTWDKHYNMTVSFGGIEEPYNINRHDHLRRRAPVYHAVDATAITTTPSLSSAVVSSLSTISSQVVFPTPDVSAAATATSAIGAIATSYINTPILPPAVVGGALDGLSVLGLSPPDGLTVSCLNCSTFGGLVLTRGQFSTSSQPQNASAFAKHEQRDVIDDMEDMISYIEHGFVELQTTGNVGAHIELETLWTPVAGVAYAVSLATFPLSPFIIPDVAVVGPQVRLQLVLAATLSIPLNFTYGFSVSVPDNATAIAAFNPVNASTVTGFDKTTFSALPFSAHVGGVDLNLSATFRPEVLVGVNLLNGAATAGAGVFLDLPRVGVSVQHVKGVDANCNPSTDANLVGSIDSHFGPLARVVPEVALAAGVVAQANLSLAKIGVQAAWTPLATNFPAPTSCLAFDKGASGYKTAAAALAAATSSSAATPGRVMGMRQGWSVAQGLAMALLVGLLAGFILL